MVALGSPEVFFSVVLQHWPPKKVMLTVVSKMGMGRKPDTPDTSQKPDARARVHRSIINRSLCQDSGSEEYMQS